jgi:hypothetical protein
MARDGALVFITVSESKLSEAFGVTSVFFVLTWLLLRLGQKTNADPSNTSDPEQFEALRCSQCGAVYRLGHDAISITSEELAKMMPT